MRPIDRKSTRLNSSHLLISYAVFCLKKKKSNCPCGRRFSEERSVGARDGHQPSGPKDKTGSRPEGALGAGPCGLVCFFFLMIRRPPRSTLFPYNDALPISTLSTGVGITPERLPTYVPLSAAVPA